jgi:hypothetical protein
MENKQLHPLLKFREFPVSGKLEIKLDSSRPVKAGSSKFGVWYLWFGHVKNATVYEGKGEQEKKIDNYTGKVMFFPSEDLNHSLIVACSDKNDVTVGISKEAAIGKKGLIAKYAVEKMPETQLAA